MYMKTAVPVALGLFLAAMPGVAHHSFFMFDTTKQITLTGTVTEFQWTNPHSYIEIDAPDQNGAVKHWTIEMGSPDSVCSRASIGTGDSECSSEISETGGASCDSVSCDAG